MAKYYIAVVVISWVRHTHSATKARTEVKSFYTTHKKQTIKCKK